MVAKGRIPIEERIRELTKRGHSLKGRKLIMPRTLLVDNTNLYTGLWSKSPAWRVIASAPLKGSQ